MWGSRNLLWGWVKSNIQYVLCFKRPFQQQISTSVGEGPMQATWALQLWLTWITAAVRKPRFLFVTGKGLKCSTLDSIFFWVKKHAVIVPIFASSFTFFSFLSNIGTSFREEKQEKPFSWIKWMLWCPLSLIYRNSQKKGI